MTNAELLAKIKAEIERNRQAIRVLNEHTAPEQMSKTCVIFQYSDTILSALLTFLSTLESENPVERIGSYNIVPYIDDKIAALQDMWREEKVAFDWDDMHEMIEDVARHFYNLGLNARKEENK